MNDDSTIDGRCPVAWSDTYGGHWPAYRLDPTGVRIEIVDRATFPDWPGFLDIMRA